MRDGGFSKFESCRQVNGIRTLWILLVNYDIDDSAVAPLHGPCIRDRKKDREKRHERTAEKHLADGFSVSRSGKTEKTPNGHTGRKPFRLTLR
jgi:hypothetical protein